jgi:hypothetical protein
VLFAQVRKNPVVLALGIVRPLRNYSAGAQKLGRARVLGIVRPLR